MTGRADAMGDLAHRLWVMRYANGLAAVLRQEPTEGQRRGREHEWAEYVRADLHRGAVEECRILREDLEALRDELSHGVFNRAKLRGMAVGPLDRIRGR